MRLRLLKRGGTWVVSQPNLEPESRAWGRGAGRTRADGMERSHEGSPLLCDVFFELRARDVEPGELETAPGEALPCLLLSWCWERRRSSAWSSGGRGKVGWCWEGAAISEAPR